MKTLNDKTLNAFLDGELSENELRRIEALLDENIDAQGRLAQLQGNDALLKTAFGQLDQTPLPDALMAHILATETQKPKSNVVTLPPRHGVPARPPYFWPASIAAALVIMLGVGFGMIEMSTSPTLKAPLFAQTSIKDGDPLYTVLEHSHSAQTVKLSGKLSAQNIMTLRLADNSLCREVQLSTRKVTQRALACRYENTWNVRVMDEIRPFRKGTGFQTASDIGSRFDNALDLLGAQSPLSAGEENSLIDSGWKSVK